MTYEEISKMTREEILLQSIEIMDLTTRIKDRLKSGNILLIGDLVQLTYYDFFRINRLGARGIVCIKEALGCLGIGKGMSIDDWKKTPLSNWKQVPRSNKFFVDVSKVLGSTWRIEKYWGTRHAMQPYPPLSPHEYTFGLVNYFHMGCIDQLEKVVIHINDYLYDMEIYDGFQLVEKVTCNWGEVFSPIIFNKVRLFKEIIDDKILISYCTKKDTR